MNIFFDPTHISIAKINQLCQNTMSEWLGIEFTEIGDDYLKARMPVDHRTKQPMGVVNGGAFCTLAETTASVAANMCLNRDKAVAVGLDINANYIRNAKQGYVFGIAKPFHIGKTTQVWEIKIVDEQDNLCCISRLTVAIIPLQQDAPTGK